MAILPVTTRATTTLPTAAADELDELRRRDSVAWSRLFQQEHPFVYRAVLAQVGNRTVAEDIAGQVFLEALEGIGRYRDRGTPIRSWLLAIARHRVADWYRGQRRAPQPESEGIVPGPGDELRAALDAMEQLTPEQREVVHLRFVEGYQIEEVARLTRRSATAVKALQHRALERLRSLLRDHE